MTSSANIDHHLHVVQRGFAAAGYLKVEQQPAPRAGVLPGDELLVQPNAGTEVRRLSVVSARAVLPVRPAVLRLPRARCSPRSVATIRSASPSGASTAPAASGGRPG